MISDNLEKISNQDFQIEEMRNQIANLTTNLNELKSEVDDIKDIGLRKTYNFSKHPPQTRNKESWDKTKLTLAKEIKVIMSNVPDDMIILKIERSHKAP